MRDWLTELHIGLLKGCSRRLTDLAEWATALAERREKRARQLTLDLHQPGRKRWRRK